MATKTLFYAVIAAAGLAGCATPGPSPEQSKKSLTCSDLAKECKVTVTVGNCPILQCLSVDYDLVLITDKKKITITWLLSNQGDYAFADPDGIKFDQSGSDFKCKADGKWKYACTNDNSRVAAYKYTVNVKGLLPIPPLDPWIVNN